MLCALGHSYPNQAAILWAVQQIGEGLELLGMTGLRGDRESVYG